MLKVDNLPSSSPDMSLHEYTPLPGVVSLSFFVAILQQGNSLQCLSLDGTCLCVTGCLPVASRKLKTRRLSVESYSNRHTSKLTSEAMEMSPRSTLIPSLRSSRKRSRSVSLSPAFDHAEIPDYFVSDSSERRKRSTRTLAVGLWKPTSLTTCRPERNTGQGANGTAVMTSEAVLACPAKAGCACTAWCAGTWPSSGTGSPEGPRFEPGWAARGRQRPSSADPGPATLPRDVIRPARAALRGCHSVPRHRPDPWVPRWCSWRANLARLCSWCTFLQMKRRHQIGG
ncbi:hypothetical protein BaRGS_00040337 [Batillaria attramentaria]|uniref:Uncharacterized protein n=1 Tax=Batillaria attramentaria TaxID=370345 RepID=A0ABD0J0P4_9CAEN